MILKYLASRLRFILLAIVLMLLFTLLWYLTGGDMDTALYYILVAAAIACAFFAADFISERSRYKRLREISEAAEGFDGALPQASGPAEAELTDIAEAYRKKTKQAAAEAERARNRTEDYYAMWVHQIKTPVAGLQLMIRSGSANAMDMERELFNIERYADMALQYARSENIANDIVISKCSVDDIVRECVKKYALFFIGNHLSIDIRESGRTLYTDPKWFAFVIEQILSNAVKYTRSGGVSIRCTGDLLTISDTGIGIRQSDLARVFEQGYTGSNGRMDKRATGLGLHLAKTVADRLGMGISIQSEPGRGTRVTLRLPEPPPRFE